MSFPHIAFRNLPISALALAFVTASSASIAQGTNKIVLKSPETAPRVDYATDAETPREVLRPDTPAAADAAEDGTTHPVVFGLLQQLTEDPKTVQRAHEDDILAIATFYAAETSTPVWTTDKGFSQRAQKVMAIIRKADDWGLKSADFVVPEKATLSSSRDAIAAAELKIAVAALKYARHARGGRMKPSSVSRLFDQKPEIADPLSVLGDLATSTNPGAYLTKLHPQHPQFERLRQALREARRKKELAASNEEKEKTAAPTDRKAKANRKSRAKKMPRKKTSPTIGRILANMERWRWIPRDLGSFYVWDDVPAQMTSVVSEGEVLFHERMVVGKPNTPTPMFSSDMKYIIFHPSWGVPPGMKRNELLPQLRNTSNGGWFSSKPTASAVLKSHGLRVTRGGHPVNPDSVDWSKANISNYHFTQPPGRTNVLGVVKFRFPNRHNVYMHDTPERHLFGGKQRAFSHGCMRIKNPIRLAEVLLKHDKGWDKDEVRQKKSSGARIELTTPIPVHIAYFTVDVDEAGKIDVRRDIYGLDRRVLSKLDSSEVLTTSVKKKRKTYRKKRRVRRAAKKPDRPFNPFASIHD